MLDELAWLLATYPDPNSRDCAEAVYLAERACALTDRQRSCSSRYAGGGLR